MDEMLTDFQTIREQEMADLGRSRARANVAKAIERGEGVETPAGVQLTKRAIQPLVDAINEFCGTANAGRAGRRNTAAMLLAPVPVELAAFFTVKALIQGCIGQKSVKWCASRASLYIEDELIAARFEDENDALYRAVVRNAENRGLAPARVAKAVRLAAKKFELKNAQTVWTVNERIHIGSKLIELAVERLGFAEVAYVKVGKNTAPKVFFTARAEKWFSEYNDAATLVRPLYLPCVAPPKPWESTQGGAYYSPAIGKNPLIMKSFPGQLELLEQSDMKAVYRGLNALQETPWRINKRVLEVMQVAWDRDAGLPCLPRREDEVVPEAPQEVVDDVKGGEKRKEWRMKMRAIHERNASNRSERFEFMRSLMVAAENKDVPAIYFPHRLDFRGRAYAGSTTLQPQGADYARGLLEFAEGKPLGERGLYWLGVHGANLFGNDKVSLDERYQWAINHANQAAQVAADPLGDLWWTEADKPWCFLAWCFEWGTIYAGATAGVPETEFVSHLPIALDGSCNGIQHFSAMLRDEVGGAAVNLVPSEKPQDIYQSVADRTTERLKELAKGEDDNQWLAEGWLAFGLDRKITKRAVMVLPYGGTFKACMDYVRDAVREKIAGGKENPFGDQLPKAEAFLAGQVWKSIGDVVVAARAAMGWLQACTRVANEANVEIRWTTPSGFVGVQAYREMDDYRIKTRFGGSLVYFKYAEETQRFDKNKQVSAISPNFVHSLDASAMMLTIGKCLDAGVTDFAMIHDSYGTHAATTDKLAELLREAFVEMYESHDVLAKFREELAGQLPPEMAEKLPPLPTKGSLDLSKVRESHYFFA